MSLQPHIPRPRRRSWRAACAVALLATATPMTLTGRPKNDNITMKNGDRYTCEIVGLDQGQLKVKTVNTTGSVLLDWAKVDRIQSTQFFVVELSDGSYLAGSIEKVPVAAALNDFRVAAGGKTASVSSIAVVSIARSGRRLKGRLSGAVSAGFNYTRGNSTTQYNVSANATARSRTQEFTTAVSSTFSVQSGTESTRHTDVSIQYWKALSRKWLLGSYDDFLRSDEQQLDLRATFGAVGARRLVRTNRTNLTLGGGVVFTTERYQASTERPEEHRGAGGREILDVPVRLDEHRGRVVRLPKHHNTGPASGRH